MTPKTALLIAVAWIVLVVLATGPQQVNEEAMRHRNVQVRAPAGLAFDRCHDGTERRAILEVWLMQRTFGRQNFGVIALLSMTS